MTLGAIRRSYAEEVRAVAHLESAAVVEAFARVPREEFLGPGPCLAPHPRVLPAALIGRRAHSTTPSSASAPVAARRPAM
ncbi:MAG TPA: hypothetical protein VFT22_21570 [Kofleriaceae bacterium]|nr:hypothetical protein [Kofleriaceae bacterium]